MLDPLRWLGRCRLAGITIVCLVAPALAAAADECSAWPGEPAPLPNVDDRAPHSARWAELRAEELVLRAQLAENADPMEALRLWRRVLCLDSTSGPARNGVGRISPVHTYQPDLRWGLRQRGDRKAPWAQLALAIRVPEPAPAISRETRERLADAEAQITAGEVSLASARFHEALASARSAETSLGATAQTHTVGRSLRARAAVVAGTAHIALGESDAARESFGRALQANPRLKLDPAQTSPKVIQAFDAARAGRLEPQ